MKIRGFFLLIAILLLALAIGVLLCLSANSAGREDMQIKIDFVDDQINELQTSDVYIEGTFAEREKIASIVLQQLEKDGYIKNLFQRKEDCMFSFQYADGTLGGVKIDEMSQKPDELPMN